MIVGVGIDIVETERIKDSIKKYGDKFLKRIFTNKELKYCGRRSHQLAARFAAKEAYSKAIGTGISGIDWKEIEVFNNKAGKPFLSIRGKASKKVHLSLSHSLQYAVASVYVEK
ncbi:MAG: holo-ACP synthase [bacterium]